MDLIILGYHGRTGLACLVIVCTIGLDHAATADGEQDLFGASAVLAATRGDREIVVDTSGTYRQ